MTHIDAMKQVVVYFEHMVRTLQLRDESEPAQLLFKLRQAIEEAERQDQQIDQLILERDHAHEIIDKICDAVLGADRHEWSSMYFFEDAVRDVEERMAEAEKQEPVAWVLLRQDDDGFEPVMFYGGKEKPEGDFKARFTLRPVCFADTRPPQRTWVGLTDEEIDEWTPEIHVVIKAIESKLKQNNGY